MNGNVLNSHQFPEVYEELGINLNSLGCVMIDVGSVLADVYFPEEALHTSPNKERYWIKGAVAQKNPHITLLYGLLRPAHTMPDLIDAVLSGWLVPSLEIEKLDVFPSPFEDEPYSCVIARIKVTPELAEGHARLEFLPHINTFSQYEPHLTLAYVKEEFTDATLSSLLYLEGLKISGGVLNLGKRD